MGTFIATTGPDLALWEGDGPDDPICRLLITEASAGHTLWSLIESHPDVTVLEDDGGPCCLGAARGSDHDPDCFARGA